MATIVQILENPFVAAALGLVFAVGLFSVSRWSIRRIQPGEATQGVMFAAISLFARLAAVTLALWAYKTYLTPGFKPFAFTLAGGFLVLYAVELYRYAGPQRRRKPSSVHQ